jgi:eukaryotic-like serine/threonine-protein kinase
VALPLFRETLKVREARLGREHPETLESMNNLAGAYRAAGKVDLALPLFEKTLKVAESKLGPDHPYTLRSMHNLAAIYHDVGKRDLALPLFEATLKLKKAKLGPEHPDTLWTMKYFAVACQESGKMDRALRLLEETLPVRRAKLGPDHPETLRNMNDVAVLYWKAKRLDKSIPLFEETVRLQEAKLGRQHLDTLRAVANLGVNYKDAGRITEALPLLEEAYGAAQKYPSLYGVGGPLLETYARVGKSGEAASLANDMLAYVRKTLPKQSPRLTGQLGVIASLLLQAKAYSEAESLLRECLTIHEKMEPEAWTTFNTKSMLGGALLGQKKHAEAEPLLLAGYEGMKQREAKIPPQGKVPIDEALDRLIELAKAQGKKQEEAKWKAELDARKKSSR